MITCMLPLEVQTTSMAFGCTMGEAIAILKVSKNHARTRRVSDRELRSACMAAHYEASYESVELSNSRYLPLSKKYSFAWPRFRVCLDAEKS